MLEPTRDLAVQTYDCFVHFAKYLESPSLRITLCVGGIDDRKQKQELQAGVRLKVIRLDSPNTRLGGHCCWHLAQNISVGIET